MDDLGRVRELGADLDGAGAGFPDALRSRVMNRVVSAAGARGGAVRARVRNGRRLVLAGGVTAVLLAAGMLVARVVAPVGPVPGVAGGGEVADVLHHAARVALTRTEPEPASGRFTFVESIAHYSDAVQQRDGTFVSRDRGRQLWQVWQSTDGSRDGLARFRPASDPGASWKTGPVGRGTPGYRSDLPTDAAGARGYLYAHSQGDNPPDVQAFVTAIDLLLGTFLTPAQQAAIFDALATIPGLTLRSNVTDLAGRSGVAVVLAADAAASPAATFVPWTECVIFAPGTGAYLGTGESARLRQAIVDQPGQLPPG